MSPIKSILLHLDASPRSDERLAIARLLATVHQASVSGLFAVISNFFGLPFALLEESATGQAVLELDADRRNRARERFDRVMQEPGPAVQWSELESDTMVWSFAEQALCADLVMLGQRETDPAFGRDLPPDFLESVLIGSGKPCLVVPNTKVVDTLGRQVLVAWNGTRESARALAASMPFLQRAERVDVVVWQDPAANHTLDDRSRLERYLRAHDIPATLHWYGSAPTDAGNSLLSLASDLSSDLLVMGCYGHTRAREWLLGGATRTVLATMTVPVLMVH